MRITKCIRESLGLPDWVESISRSNGFSWNGWLEAENGFVSFQTGIYWQVMEHLAKCERCREANNLSLEEVKKQLEEIEEEWKSVTGE